MLLNIGIILSIGIVSPLKRLNYLDHFWMLLTQNGEVSKNSWKISALKLLLISDQDGPGLPNKETILPLSTLPTLEIHWQPTINHFWPLISGNMLTTLITETPEPNTSRTSPTWSTGNSLKETSHQIKSPSSSDFIYLIDYQFNYFSIN